MCKNPTRHSANRDPITKNYDQQKARENQTLRQYESAPVPIKRGEFRVGRIEVDGKDTGVTGMVVNV